ncbi:S-adenosyl-L-methionine-dependent methyltransferase [Pilobolus umbonatus]|nr:S-adenosyl-L-methionine-dependent methyltransferase [Pilobolus umbonatus]
MSQVTKLKTVQCAPFLTFLAGVVDATIFNESKLKVLEVGCGPGDFTVLLKEHYRDLISITAIDPNESDIKEARAKSEGTGISFEIADIFNFKSDTIYDIIIFTKSLHHCVPVDKAMDNAYRLLNDGGLLFAEEIDFDSPDDRSLQWFFDRIDLLYCAGAFAEAQPITETSNHRDKMIAKAFNKSLSIHDRWLNKHRHDLATMKSIKSTIEHHFGEGNVQFSYSAPFFYQMLTHFG